MRIVKNNNFHKYIIDDLSRRIEHLDGSKGGIIDNSRHIFNKDNDGSNNNSLLLYWKGKQVIPMVQWRKIANHLNYVGNGADALKIEQALQYFPNEYNDYLFAFGVPDNFEYKADRSYNDYRDLHEYVLISKYGPDTFRKMMQEQSYQEEKKA
ncbi:MAG: hypothetical protein ACJ72R_14570 [Nitrososphaeraceae archaeon]